MTTPPFSLDGYRKLIDILTGVYSYEIRDFDDVNPGQRHLIIRHDIDVSIQTAVELARAEADAGLRATYCVLLRTEMYNPLSRRNVAALHEAIALGHRIGLHFDASLYDWNSAQDLTPFISAECGILENTLGIKIPLVSFHRPVQSLLGAASLDIGRAHSYEPRFYQAIGYCSDSQGRWRYGSPLEHPALEAGTALQLLTHPVWWVASEGVSATHKVNEALARNASNQREEAAENIKTYMPDMQ